MPAQNRARLEELCRYLLRPPVTQDRLWLMGDGRVRLTLKTRWADGTSHLFFEPVEFLEKLTALIPRSRVKLVFYPGVLAPRAGSGRGGSGQPGGPPGSGSAPAPGPSGR